jgi:deferrochelatase/peroxidase EfeB
MKEHYLALKKIAPATQKKLAIVKKKLTSHLDKNTLDNSDKNMKDILRKAMTYIKKTSHCAGKLFYEHLWILNENESTNEEMAELRCNKI